MAALAKQLAEHVSTDDPNTTFTLYQIQEAGRPDHWEVECTKEKNENLTIHWNVRFNTEDKARAEFARWLSS